MESKRKRISDAFEIAYLSGVLIAWCVLTGDPFEGDHQLHAIIATTYVVFGGGAVIVDRLWG